MGKLESLPLERKEESYQRKKKGGRGKQTKGKIQKQKKRDKKKKPSLRIMKKKQKNRSPTLTSRLR